MKKAILLAAYGAGNPWSRAGLASFEAACRRRFPFCPIRWAYTSSQLRERIAREKRKSDSVLKALTRLHFEKFDSVAVQPLQTIPGREYEEVCAAVEAARSLPGFDCAAGAPLLSADIETAASALLAHLPEERTHADDAVFMGHGAKHAAEAIYGELAEALGRLDCRVFVGTMGGTLALENILPKLAGRTVWLLPLLSSVGQHALRDMAGSGPDSWKSRIEGAGFVCKPVLRGMAESPGLANIWLNHLETALIKLNRA